MRALLLALVSFMSIPVSAGVWEERQLLERYIEQLEILNETLLADAENAADPYMREKLNYTMMRRDVREVISKLRHHLDTPLEQYRSPNYQINNKEYQSRE
ncbi:RAQPRD family integrative conjugative element protein [Vibrio mediterranei]